MKLDGMSDGSEKEEEMEKEAIVPLHHTNQRTEERTFFLSSDVRSSAKNLPINGACRVRRRRARNDWRREGRSRAEGGRTSVSCWRDSQMI